MADREILDAIQAKYARETGMIPEVTNSGIDWRFPDEPTRPDWDTYFLAIADVVKTRSDCVRRKVGAVIVRNNRIVATGYNGAPAGKPGCESCPRSRSDVPPGSSYDTGPGSCVAIHGEANALLYADSEKCIDARMYITEAPCDGCLKLIMGAGISWVIYPNGADHVGMKLNDQFC